MRPRSSRALHPRLVPACPSSTHGRDRDHARGRHARARVGDGVRGGAAWPRSSLSQSSFRISPISEPIFFLRLPPFFLKIGSTATVGSTPPPDNSQTRSRNAPSGCRRQHCSPCRPVGTIDRLGPPPSSIQGCGSRHGLQRQPDLWRSRGHGLQMGTSAVVAITRCSCSSTWAT